MFLCLFLPTRRYSNHNLRPFLLLDTNSIYLAVMFESDDFDQVLSQFDFPEVPPKQNDNLDKNIHSDENIFTLTNLVSNSNNNNNSKSEEHSPSVNIIQKQSPESNLATRNDTPLHSLQAATPSKPFCENIVKDNFISPKHSKRKIINSHFDLKVKRKFPGPAGLLTGTLEESKDENICHMELLSQDIEFSQNSLQGDIFQSPLWLRLLEDMKAWNLHNTDDIKSIKQQALAGNLRRRKAQTVRAFVESIDRSAIDPLIILRDSTGHIKCTLHRDAWSTFSTYIVSESCALVLWKPTVLTTGGAFKKHYLNITLSNIYAIYSSIVVDQEEKQLPNGFVIVSEDDFTVIKTEITPQDLGPHLTGCDGLNGGATEENLLDDLDSIFSDDLF